MPTLTSLLHIGCTRVLDAEIQNLRAQYASERVDFHSFFQTDTVAGIQQILRVETRGGPETEQRRMVLGRLLWAQQTSPHPLWEALLVQAFERTLVKRRRALSSEEGDALEQLVIASFKAALENIPWAVYADDLGEYVLRRSRMTLARMRRGASKSAVPVPRASGVVLAGTYANDVADPTEVA